METPSNASVYGFSRFTGSNAITKCDGTCSATVRWAIPYNPFNKSRWLNRSFHMNRYSRLAMGQMVVSSCLTPRAIWVTTGDCPPMIPCTANFPTSCSRFSGKCSKTGPRNPLRALSSSATGKLAMAGFCSIISIAPPSAVVGLFALPIIPRWAEFASPRQLVGNHQVKIY